jgi:anti-sigma factor RsiW
MALTHNELIYLMAYVDGQVDDDEIPEVEALLAKSEEARRIVAQHQAMGDWVRARGEELGAKKGVDSIAADVMQEVEKLGGAQVITIERARAKRALNFQRVKEFGALAAVAAVAAAFYLWPDQSESPLPHATPVAMDSAPTPADSATAPPSPPPSAEEPPLAMASNDTAGGVDVEAVESPAHQFSVFYVPASLNTNAQSVVVWIGDE